MKLVELKLNCCGDVHTISVYEPEDEWACMPEREIIGPEGCHICLENHNYDTEKVFYELGATVPTCVNVIREKERVLVKAMFDELDETRSMWVEAAVVAICAGASIDKTVGLLLIKVAETENFLLFKHLVEVHGATAKLLAVSDYISTDIFEYILEKDMIDRLSYNVYLSMQRAASRGRTDIIDCWVKSTINNVSRFDTPYRDRIEKLSIYLKMIRQPILDMDEEFVDVLLLNYLNDKINQLSSLMERGGK